MKKSILMACVCAAALSLSACGGGGDDSDAQPADPKAPPAVPNPSAQSGNVNPSRQPATPAAPAPAAPSAIAGAALTAERNDLTTARRVGVSGDRNSVISINGHNITVARPEFEDQNFGTLSDDGKTRTITNGHNILSYVRFGFHTDFDGKQHHVFAVGDATPADKVPTDGDTYYIGLSTFAMGPNPAFRTGLSSFHVNFGEKTIDGEVYGDSRVNPIALGGTINGNAFSGSKNGVEMQGHFYGPQAEQVGGIFKGTATDIPGIDEPTPVMGSFGARRL